MIHPLTRVFILIIGIVYIIANPINAAHAQETGGFYNPDDDEEVVYEGGKADDKKLKDFYGLSEEDLYGEIVLDVETEEETRIANEKFRRELEEERRIKAQKDRLSRLAKNARDQKTEQEKAKTSQDYFSGINQTSGSDQTPEYKRPKPKPLKVEVQDLITLEPIQVKLDATMVSDLFPNITDSRLVQTKIVTNGARINRGSRLELSIIFHRPKDLKYTRKVGIFSSLASPEFALSKETKEAMNIYSDSQLKWNRTNRTAFKSTAFLKDWLQVKYQKTSGNLLEYNGKLWFETAHLKPGKYWFVIETKRKNGQTLIEKDKQVFEFTLVDKPLFLSADIPKNIPVYDHRKEKITAMKTGHIVNISDWAVRPLKARLRPTDRGVRFPGEGLSSDDLQAKSFEMLIMPERIPPSGRSKFKLIVTDGLGRVATLDHAYNVTDGRDYEMKVHMATTVNAGDTVHGTITYPRGFELKKEPHIGDRRGFSWTNSSFTAFKIKVKEEGVHHKRLMGIVAVGRIKGVDYAPTLTVMHKYTVKSHNLIYDKERNRRRTAANNKIFSDALGALASGVGAAASAYVEINKNSGSGGSYTLSDDDYDDGDEGFQAIAPPAYGSPNYDGINIDTGPIKPLSTIAPSQPNNQPSGNSYATNRALNNPDNFPIGGENSEEITETNICGVAILGKRGHYDKNGDVMFESNRGWIRDRDDNSDFEVNNRDYDVVLLTKLGIPYDGHQQIHELAFYKHNCAQAYETIPTSTGASSMYEFHTNGGKKLVDTAHVDRSKNVYKEWDRAGNLINHVGGNGDTICSNNPSHEAPRKCS